MKIEILFQGVSALAQVEMDGGETIVAESGAMVSMTPTITLEGKMEGGAKKALGRMFGAGESFFQSTFTANAPGVVTLAPKGPGDIMSLECTPGVDYKMARGVYLASRDMKTATEMQKISKGFFSGAGLFILHASVLEGETVGTLLISSYGSIVKKELQPGEEFIVDNDHLVSWTCEYAIQKAASGWISSFKSGEGLVCRCTGPGVVYYQTRNYHDLASMLIPYLPTRN